MADVVIVGAGLAGLCCALELEQRGVEVLLLDAADAPGGRIRTDVVQGFRLDRGFQVLLTAYSEAQRVLDYSSLDLGRFVPGAQVRYEGKFHSVADPLRAPGEIFASATAPIGSLGDKLRVAGLKSKLTSNPDEHAMDSPEVSTLERLKSAGFSDRMIQRFFRPFFGGIYLESELATSSRKFDYIFRMFSHGEAALPALGMQAIPEQIAARLRYGTLRFESSVVSVNPRSVRLHSGEILEARAVVLAVEEHQAAMLLGQQPSPARWTSTTCLYFSCDEPPFKGPWLMLNGDGVGPINNLCFPSEVCPSYAPQGKALASVTVLGAQEDNDVEHAVRGQLESWFGEQARRWHHLRTYRIPYGLPKQLPGSLTPVMKPVRAGGVFVCGDYCDLASIQGALRSGRRAAEAVLENAS
jgi:phytoene dehydrogenase-like protein